MPSQRSSRQKKARPSGRREAVALTKSVRKRRENSAGGARPAPNDAHEVILNGGMARTLGVRLISVTRKRVAAEMPVTAKHMNRSGRVNGGALMAFADALGATGTVANLPAGHRTTTLESKTNFFAAGEAPVLRAVCRPLHIGRTTMVWQTTIRNADRRLVAVVTQTQMVLPMR
jgi:uncharacterized protein (TIGR00369 family)